MKNILVLGLGKVGSLVGTLLSSKFNVKGLDQNKPHYNYKLSFDVIQGDVADLKSMKSILKDFDAVVSALPFFLNKNIAKLAHDLNLHYFDLTEDVKTTKYIKKLSKTAKKIMAPQCGLAPGLIGIIGNDLAMQFDELRDIELRVGALPRYPNGQLAYSFTWSPHGVINEYINDAEVIQNGVKKTVPSLDGFEYINIEGQEFEAFTTSGGLGTMCDTYEGKLDTLNYKTIRYPGHGKLMRFLMYELILKNDKSQLEKILSNAKPPVDDDVVYVYAVVEGWKKKKISRSEFFKAFYPIEIQGKKWRAISWTTAASLAAIIEMVANGKLPNKGFIKQEEISYNEFLKTSSGKLFLN
ncbi:MAG: L-lysine dehydrogenase [Flavobacteriaceae bacterium]|jgi:saccharopine dehydrogenase-like NADP-dependent oxidoreductase|nr:L-lysine dehydrogenase [Flavobacteriaceae bacterium]MBT6170560.1 L-lysine dehydrogenase [Flavobacteriaceae bacterium]MBT6353223.1 L-lysine dehydrogenase [Pelagibacteraceae bacterium]MBT7623685.1 L-lysine dehydrogenase [Flavobacteriaceae bacterium]MDG1831094.1 saccharopine dehydrogenase C-terminal domain-containing protein [Flavobacteriaceae bacterium]